jgi:hypothetical protein
MQSEQIAQAEEFTLFALVTLDTRKISDKMTRELQLKQVIRSTHRV